MTIDSYSQAELAHVATRLVEAAGDKRVWCFHGEMGSGKTTLIKKVCEQLGVTDAMSSPSFSIINQYLTKTAGFIYHFDFYRLKTVQEALDIGVEEYLYSGEYCMVEWPEKFESLIPENHLTIHMIFAGELNRSLHLT